VYYFKTSWDWIGSFFVYINVYFKCDAVPKNLFLITNYSTPAKIKLCSIYYESMYAPTLLKIL